MTVQLLLLAWAVDPTWAIPALGCVVCGLAFVLGRRFLFKAPLNPSPDDETFLKGVTTERRATARRKGNAVEVFLSDEVSEPIPAWVVDRSMGGLCVIVDRPLTEGVTLKIRPRTAPTTMPWTPVLIKSCRPDAGQWEVGCQFTRTPNWNELLQFG
jgi:hypothetical protein